MRLTLALVFFSKPCFTLDLGIALRAVPRLKSLYVDKLPEQLHDWQVALIAALEQLQFLYLHFEVSLVSAIDLLSNHKWPALEALAVHSDIPADDAWLKHPKCLKFAVAAFRARSRFETPSNSLRMEAPQSSISSMF